MSGKNFKYSKEHIQYLREIANGKFRAEITDLFNQKFGTQLSKQKIAGAMARNRIKCNSQGGEQTRFKKEQPLGTKVRNLSNPLAHLASKKDI